jgi:hypothetical protein
MKTTIRYDQATRQARTDAALADCKAYLGATSYEKVLQGIRDYWQENRECSRPCLYRGTRMALSLFVGIEGKYPCRAMIREAGKPAPRPHLTLILTGSMRTIPMDAHGAAGMDVEADDTH